MSDLTKKVVEIGSAVNKVRGRPFAPGNKLGQGRPKGTRNKPKPLFQRLLEEYSEHLVRKLIALAMQGNQSAMRMCMDRISPARRSACITMSLPAIRTARDVDKAAEKVTQAIRRGELTPADGGIMMNILEGRSRVIERGQLETRLEKLEENLAATKKRPAA
jgi:hypothetical protein